VFGDSLESGFQLISVDSDSGIRFYRVRLANIGSGFQGHNPDSGNHRFRWFPGATDWFFVLFYSQFCFPQPADMDDEDLLLVAVGMSIAAISSYIDQFVFAAESPPMIQDLRFIRPSVSYMDYLAQQETLLSDCGDRVIYDTFRMDGSCLNTLVCIATPFLKATVDPKEVVCITLHWLATGASARAQEQFFLDKAYSTIHRLRCEGLRAILRGLVDLGFYGDDINDPSRIASSKAAFGAKEPSLAACIGAVDGTHIAVVVPNTMADRYRNRLIYTNYTKIADF
jgi:hypothetical protein